MTQKTKDWDINDSQFPRLQVQIRFTFLQFCRGKLGSQGAPERSYVKPDLKPHLKLELVSL